jgi:tetraacyldisaccharide 4'-kinase
VISVGNLRVGGSGKTPVAAHLAGLLAQHGERPSILSRGYARARATDGVTVVSDGIAIRADLAHAGDEPLLLARAVPTAPVLVCAERALAGRLAEEQFDVTVHLLDDGFQHLQLARDIDLLLVDPADLDDRVLPAGRLRDPLKSAKSADAALISGVDPAEASSIGERLGIPHSWSVVRKLGEPRFISAGYGGVAIDRACRVFAVAGIARPDRFFDDLMSSGWRVAGAQPFRDHYRFQQRDVEGIARQAASSGAGLILTTEKDAVRLEGLDLSRAPFASVALEVSIEPAGAFAGWLFERLGRARMQRSPAAASRP